MTHLHERLRYRLITGPDDADFCLRVSRLLDEGYELYGSPTITFDGSRTIVAQALVLPPYEAVRFRQPGAVAPVQTDTPQQPPPGGRPAGSPPVEGAGEED